MHFMHTLTRCQFARTLHLNYLNSNRNSIAVDRAGRIHDNSFVDCNDAGVELIETEVHATNVLDVIKDSCNAEKLKQYLPMEPYGEAVLLAVQINFFSCGGTAIGTCLSHKIADGTSLVTFINAWASTCRGVSDQIVQASFDLAQHFPPKDLSGTSLTPNIVLTNEKIVTKRFIFDKEKVAALREAVIGSQLIKTPTRVEAVSAYIWKHFMEVAEGKMNKKKMFGALHIVNLRPRTSPPLSQHTFGNCWSAAIALFTADDNNNHEYQDLAKELGLGRSDKRNR
ncbi:HXXXD-type acyl-transferase family protein [Abeliophyllum distichum]|uniref:HXXXD-type acyl-transferase family protein n=1 Tax=Abeliophyllum distichum TaxID=126358 RepID=A0ABD1VQK3_9LAMI